MGFNRQEPMTTNTRTSSVAVDAGLRSYMLQVYNFMASALVLTGIVAYMAGQSEAFMQLMLTQKANGAIGMSGLAYVVMFAPLGIVIYLSARLNSLSSSAAQGWFWAYSVATGLSLWFITQAYTGESISRVFFITSITFGGMSLFGYTTKRDLTGVGSFLMMGLWGIIIASIVNMFMESTAMSYAISYIGIIVFTGLTAYDTQKLKAIYYGVSGDAEMTKKSAIMGALNLYLDFLNLFLMLLRVMGDRR
jgi:FtsH-binding integral membrane protein